MKRIIAIVMLVGAAAGSALSFMGFIGDDEPQLVLQLSWFALLFSSIDALFIEQKS